MNLQVPTPSRADQLKELQKRQCDISEMIQRFADRFSGSVVSPEEIFLAGELSSLYQAWSEIGRNIFRISQIEQVQ